MFTVAVSNHYLWLHQPCIILYTFTVILCLQHLTRLQMVNKMNKSDFTKPPDSAKQRSAMPPNFVHSLDSTHMMLTSLYCQRFGSFIISIQSWTSILHWLILFILVSIIIVEFLIIALFVVRAGIPFVAVHDSYWTHPCFVDNMNKVDYCCLSGQFKLIWSFSEYKICREQFVSLHNEPILDDLADFFEKKYGGLELVVHILCVLC